MTCVSVSLVAAPHIEGLPTDCLVRDVLPQGHAFGASAPELMSAAAKVRQGLLDDDLKINGCAADMWSAGTVLYEMLTGHRAFNPTLPEGNIPPAQGRHDWFGTVLRQTKFVVSLALQLMFCQVKYCINASSTSFCIVSCLMSHVEALDIAACCALPFPHPRHHLCDVCCALPTLHQGRCAVCFRSYLLYLQRDSISNAKSHSDLMAHPMFNQIAHCSSRPDLAVDFFRGLFEDSPTKRMSAMEALRHPYLQDCVLEMQKARQGNSTYKYTSGCRQPPKQRRAGGLSKLKKMFSSKASAERHPDRSQQASPPPDLDWFFPPYETSRNR